MRVQLETAFLMPFYLIEPILIVSMLLRLLEPIEIKENIGMKLVINECYLKLHDALLHFFLGVNLKR